MPIAISHSMAVQSFNGCVMTTHNKKQQRDRLINAITLYLKAHPNAADSVEGIMQWWLPQQQNPVDIDDLQQALDYLVEARAVSRTALLDGRMLYTNAKNVDEREIRHG